MNEKGKVNSEYLGIKNLPEQRPNQVEVTTERGVATGKLFDPTLKELLFCGRYLKLILSQTKNDTLVID